MTLGTDMSRRGDDVDISGYGFEAESTIYLTYSIDDAVVSLGTARSDAYGSWSSEFYVPNHADIPSTNTVTATDNSGSSKSATHKIPSTNVTVDRASASPGSILTLTGTGFPGYVPVNSITIGGVEVGPLPMVATEFDGVFSASVLVPGIGAGLREVLVAAGSNSAKTTVTVLDALYNLSGNRASFSVTPGSASTGETVSVVGIGFPGWKQVRVFTVGGLDVRPTPMPATDSAGTFIFTIMVPRLNSGSYQVLAVVGDTERSAILTVK
jgi:hypothetical protein